MKKLMHRAILIGFTGTPLLRKDKKTSIETFGPFIHTYKFDEGITDKIILPLRYEARDVEQNISEPEKIDLEFDRISEGLTERGKMKLKKRWATLSKLYSSRERLERIAADILKDMNTIPRLAKEKGTAMLAAGSIYEACRYWEIFTLNGFENCAVITSFENNLPTEDKYKREIYSRMLNGKKQKDFETEAKKNFINHPESMKLLIVVDKLLTGFDAPSATYLYIDKSMRDHDLFQAICRVNRPDDESKTHGVIVDPKIQHKPMPLGMRISRNIF